MPATNSKLFAHTLSLALLTALLIASCSTPAPAASPVSPAADPTITSVGPAAPTASNSNTPEAPTPIPTGLPASGPVSFSRDLLPLFNDTCIKCHGGEKTEKGLDMNSYASLMSGSEHGAVVVPGDSSGSKLAQLVANGKMPKRGPKLTSEQVQLIENWINAGAQNN